MEAMKYEKRIETQYTSYGSWWISGRGWGDLIVGTALEFPVPYQEMQVRLEPFYLLGQGFGRPRPREPTGSNAETGVR
jgi:hypothetical protein